MPIDPNLAQYGVAVVALMVVWKVIDLLAARVPRHNAKAPHAKVDLTEDLKRAVHGTAREVRQLHDWHAPDSAGRMPWKDQDPIIKAIERLGQDLTRELRANAEAVTALAAQLKDSKGGRK